MELFVCSFFCLNAQLSEDRNVMLVGTSYSITGDCFLILSQAEKRLWNKGTAKGFSRFLNGSVHNRYPFHYLLPHTLIISRVRDSLKVNEMSIAHRI